MLAEWSLMSSLTGTKPVVTEMQNYPKRPKMTQNYPQRSNCISIFQKAGLSSWGSWLHNPCPEGCTSIFKKGKTLWLPQWGSIAARDEVGLGPGDEITRSLLSKVFSVKGIRLWYTLVLLVRCGWIWWARFESFRVLVITLSKYWYLFLVFLMSYIFSSISIICLLRGTPPPHKFLTCFFARPRQKLPLVLLGRCGSLWGGLGGVFFVVPFFFIYLFKIFYFFFFFFFFFYFLVPSFFPFFSLSCFFFSLLFFKIKK